MKVQNPKEIAWFCPAQDTIQKFRLILSKKNYPGIIVGEGLAINSNSSQAILSKLLNRKTNTKNCQHQKVDIFNYIEKEFAAKEKSWN